MKKYPFMSVLLLCLSVLLTSQCDNDPKEEPTPEPQIQFDWSFELSSETTAVLTIQVNDPQAEYGYYVTPSTALEGMDQTQMLEWVILQGPTFGKGNGSRTFEHLDWDTDYTALLFSWSDNEAGPLHSKTVHTGPAPERDPFFVWNNEQYPIRATFYDNEAGQVALFLTPADIQYFEELPDAHFYAGILLDESEMTGELIDIRDSQSANLIYVDNLYEEEWLIESGEEGPNQGSFMARSLDQEGHYEVELIMSLSDNTTLHCYYKGEFRSAKDEIEKPNEYTYKNRTYPIESVVVDQSQATPVIWLSSKAGLTTVEAISEENPIQITLPEEGFNAGAIGFSFYPDQLQISYQNQVWNKANGSNGTVEVSLDGNQMEIDFTTYGDLIGHYEGEVTLIADAYLSLVSVGDDFYSFRVRSTSEHGFYFSSGEYGALDWIYPDWDPEDPASMITLLEYLYPFVGHGDTVIECIHGQTPDWAEMEIEITTGARYFVLAAERGPEGEIIGDVAMIEFICQAE